MNDIDKMPVKCRDCPYWELAVYPWYCGDCTNRMKKPVGDFVSRQWLIDEYHRRHEGPPGGALQMIEEAPAADVEPKRKTGFWTDSEVWIDYENNARETVRCSLCNSAVDVHCAHNYCTYCGARMLPEPPEPSEYKEYCFGCGFPPSVIPPKETDGDEQTSEDI